MKVSGFDIVIKNGRVMDPLTRTDSLSDVGVSNGSIAAVVSPGQKLEGKTTIDASGLVVAPGFIDIHWHEDCQAVAASGAARKAASSTEIIFGPPLWGMECHVRDGCTTTIGGNCGTSFYPLGDYFNKLEQEGCLINYAAYSGEGTLRELAGAADRYTPLASSEQLERIKELAARDLLAGALGVSYGLMYSPGTTFEEIVATAKVAAEYGGLIAAHVRYGEHSHRTVDALQEMIRVVREANLTFQYSHIGGMAAFSEWMDECLKVIEVAQSEGLAITADVYPYFAMMGLFGSAAFDPGVFELYDAGPGSFEVAGDVIIEGKVVMPRGDRFTQELWDRIRPLVQNGTIPDPGCIIHVQRPDKVRLAMSSPYVMLGTDGHVNRDLQGNIFGHPRVAGTYARFLGRFVREEGIMDLMTALFKCSTLPARVLGLKNKGSITEGADADITIFSADEVIDKATFGSGFNIPSDGIKYVLVNGTPIISNGELIPGVRPGKVIRRTWPIEGYNPSKGM